MPWRDLSRVKLNVHYNEEVCKIVLNGSGWFVCSIAFVNAITCIFGRSQEHGTHVGMIVFSW